MKVIFTFTACSGAVQDERDLMSASQRSKSTRLSTTETVAVDWCESGEFHLHMGNLSMKLVPEDFEALLAALAHAFMRRRSMVAHQAASATDTSEAVPRVARGTA